MVCGPCHASHPARSSRTVQFARFDYSHHPFSASAKSAVESTGFCQIVSFTQGPARLRVSKANQIHICAYRPRVLSAALFFFRPCRRISFTVIRFFPTENETGQRLVPTEIRVEYLVAELERHGFEFQVSRGDGPFLSAQWPGRQPAGCEYYFEAYGNEIAKYVLKRDTGRPAWWE